jgi:hypothetical protein
MERTTRFELATLTLAKKERPDIRSPPLSRAFAATLGTDSASAVVCTPRCGGKMVARVAYSSGAFAETRAAVCKVELHPLADSTGVALDHQPTWAEPPQVRGCGGSGFSAPHIAPAWRSVHLRLLDAIWG